MRIGSLVLVAVIGLTAPPLAAQPSRDQDQSSEGAYDEAEERDAAEKAAASDEASAEADPTDESGEEESPSDGKPSDGEPSDGEPDHGKPSAPPPAPTPPSPSPDPAPSRSPIKKLQGALVVARQPAARDAAKALARAVYRDARLRPAMKEETARVLVGGKPAPGDAAQAQIAAVMKALDTVQDDDVRRRLLVSLADDLSAQLVVEVSVEGDGQPRAGVLRLPDERFLGVTLTAKRQAAKRPGDPAAWAWDDAVGILRGLLVGPPPGPRTAPAPTPPPKPVDMSDDGDSDWDLLKSPWFWGGLGVVVTVGVTVLILSQTALNEPDVVMLEGRVGP